MAGKAIPDPSILDAFEKIKARNGSQRWRSHGGDRLYEWDSLHGEVEVYNKRGRHLGVVDPHTGDQIKPAKKGRKIDV